MGGRGGECDYVGGGAAEDQKAEAGLLRGWSGKETDQCMVRSKGRGYRWENEIMFAG